MSDALAAAEPPTPPLQASWSFPRGRQCGLAQVAGVTLAVRRLGKKERRSYEWTVSALSHGWFHGDRHEAHFHIELRGHAQSEHAACVAAEAHAAQVRAGARAMADNDVDRASFQEPPDPVR